MKPVVPNTVLPKGGELWKKPRRKKGSGRYEQTFDAEVICAGVRWLRVQGGFGSRKDREDWIADIPQGQASVSDYMFREPRWGFHVYHSFEEACQKQLAEAIKQIEENASKAQKKADDLKKFLKNFRAGRIAV